MLPTKINNNENLEERNIGGLTTNNFKLNIMVHNIRSIKDLLNNYCLHQILENGYYYVILLN